MKIYFSSYHKYPGRLHGVASHSVHDNIVKGLCELGHQVFYHLKESPELPLHEGAIYTDTRHVKADIYHINDGNIEDVYDDFPWVRVLHCDVRLHGYELDICKDNWIYVSKTLASLYDSNRFVLNGINPEEFIYSETKDDYLFFIVGGVSRAEMKGVEEALSIAEKSGCTLKIAGSSNDKVELEIFRSFCEKRGAIFCGPVYGKEKAELFAGAKALLFPSRFNEACPLVVSESLMSGTPVIASANGANPELLNDTLGFICKNESDYLTAIDSLDRIKPVDCRNYALKHFHYLEMAKNYVLQYQYELERFKVSNTIF